MKRIVSLLLALLCLWISGAALAEKVHYTVHLETGTEIFSEPNFDADVVMRLPREGYFTILEEQPDSKGSVWGRLKSGAGWVLLMTASGKPQLPYRLSLPAWTPISPEPSYDVDCELIVGEKGVFTIVEEQPDGEGNIWGRLKSGAGWVDLTLVENAGDPPVTATYAEAAPLTPENHSAFASEEPEYAVHLAFRANEPVTAVRITALELVEEGYAEAELLHELSVMEADTYLVAEVVFYGDMTAYGLFFTDAKGVEHRCMVSISGRNGGVVLEELIP